MKVIFIVDDNELNLMVAKDVLSGFYKVYPHLSAEKMFHFAEKLVPDLIILDIIMPDMDGFEAIKRIKSNEKLKYVPVIFLTARQDAQAEIRGFELGALDFITKPFSPPVLLKRIESHIETDKLIKQARQEMREMHNVTISVISDMVESRDKVTGGHIERTQTYLEILVNELLRMGVYADEMSRWDLELLLPSAQLHDVGKIAVKDAILNKTERLDEKEFGEIKKHCSDGEHIIDKISAKTKDDGFLRHARLFAGCHHEKWDGSGYPLGLAGEDIPLEGRLMAVVDVYDALVSERPYKKPISHEQAVEIIKNDSGTHFDPRIAEAFLNVSVQFKEVLMSLKELAIA